MGIILIIVLVAILVIALSNNRSIFGFGGGHQCGSHQPGTHDATITGARSESPLDILAGRYARGEIDRDEYLQKKNELA